MVRKEDRPSRPARIDVHIEATLTTADGHSFAVIVRDVSAKGFRLELDEQLLVGEHVVLQVGSKDSTRAEIRWALGHEAGGLFLDAPPQMNLYS